MALVSLNEVLLPAKQHGYGVGAFEFWSFDSARAIVSAAEELNVPVILQAGPLECMHTGTKHLAYIAKEIAACSTVNVVLHLDHGDTFELAQEAIDCGFTSVMIDSSSLPLSENIRLTKKVVNLAKSKGVNVEGEIGILGGNEAGKDITESFLTDPEEALEFAQETGIDAIAVAIGTAHGVYVTTPSLRIDLLKEIVRKVGLPVVLHGGSGIPEEQIRESIRCGVCKVNICTELLMAMGGAFVHTQAQAGFRYSVPSLFEPTREAGKQLALAKLKMFR